MAQKASKHDTGRKQQLKGRPDKEYFERGAGMMQGRWAQKDSMREEFWEIPTKEGAV